MSEAHRTEKELGEQFAFFRWACLIHEKWFNSPPCDWCLPELLRCWISGESRD